MCQTNLKALGSNPGWVGRRLTEEANQVDTATLALAFTKFNEYVFKPKFLSCREVGGGNCVISQSLVSPITFYDPFEAET